MVPIHGDDAIAHPLARFTIRDDLGLEPLVGKHLEPLVPVDDLAIERLILGQDLVHLAFQKLDVVGSERTSDIKVVVEPVGDGRANGELGTRERGQHRLGQHVGRGMANDKQAFFGIGRHHLKGPAGLEGPVHIELSTVDLDHNGGLGKARPDALGDFEAGGSGGKCVNRTVGKGEINRICHEESAPIVRLEPPG
ncbi:MAG: hypothetical protein HKO63_07340 [Acidimicrobiia bacterium]|nr:hypothetical protein [Acidimicrobiia bacterium]